MTDSRPIFTCPACRMPYRVNAKGQIVKHSLYGMHCEGSYTKPEYPGNEVEVPTPAERIQELREYLSMGKIHGQENLERAKRTINQLRSQI